MHTPSFPLHALWKRIWPWQSHQPTWVCNLKICKLIKLSSEVQCFNVSGQHQQFNPSFLIIFCIRGLQVELLWRSLRSSGLRAVFRASTAAWPQGWFRHASDCVPRNRFQLSAAMFSFSKSHQCVACPSLCHAGCGNHLWIPHSSRPSSCHHPVLQAPVSRFGDTAANDGALAALEHTSLPTAVGDLSCRKQWMVLTCFNPDSWDDL
jgi:hypothetical protein